MDGLSLILTSILPPFLLLALGAFARKVSWLRAEADSSLSMVTIRILYPCFILFHILSTEAVAIEYESLLVPIFGFISILFGFILSWGVSRAFKIEPKAAKSFRFCSGIFNYGFIAIPVAQSIFGSGIIVHIILFNLGVEIAIWTVGILILSGNKLSLRGILNPPVLSVVLALCLQSLGGSRVVPVFLFDTIQMLGHCSIPIGLLLIGGSFYELMQDFKFSLKYKTEIAALVTRNVLFPLVILSLVFLLPMPNGMGWIKEILVVQAAMPAGIFAVVIVGNYAEDKDTAMRSIIVTMFASLVTLPLWIILGLSIVR
jgi:predicted permease